MASINTARERSVQVQEDLFTEASALCQRLGIVPAARPEKPRIVETEARLLAVMAIVLDLTRALTAVLDERQAEARPEAQKARPATAAR